MLETESIESPLAAWLRLALVPGLGRVSQRKLLTAFGLPEAVFSVPCSSLIPLIGEALATRLTTRSNEREQLVKSALAWAAEEGNYILTLADSQYPRALLDIADPPLLLYAKGRIELLQQPAVAIVGSRNASSQGIADAERFAATLSRSGWAIISGLALGIDASAHRGALAADGATIAVIGTGADRLYPARNKALAEQIARRGVILSEFSLGTPAAAANFPRRNRLISGLAHGVLVVEAALQSGSLITARLAGEQGKEVFAVPGSIHSPLSRGCHALIRQGAKLVESVEDILEEIGTLAPVPSSTADSKVTDNNTTEVMTHPPVSTEHPVLQALGYAPADFDTLLERSGLAAETLNAVLLELELAGRIESLPGSCYQRLST